MKQIISILLLSLLLFSCVQSNNENGLGGYIDEETYQNEFMTDNDEPLILEMEFDSITIDTSFIDFTNNIIAYLKNDNLIQFATTFHPKKGCKFIPYPYLVEEDLVFSNDDFRKELQTNKKLHWGMYDSSGEPIDLTIKNYVKQFVYDVNYKDKATDININENLTISNTINNISEFYPKAQYIEFYYDGTAEFEGMDWSSLIFYIEKLNNKYYLVAVVHNQWTI